MVVLFVLPHDGKSQDDNHSKARDIANNFLEKNPNADVDVFTFEHSFELNKFLLDEAGFTS